MRAQHPLTLSGDTEPEPDFALVEEEDPRAYLGSHPKTALLVIEVAYSSLDKDRTSKAALYAKSGIPEYWVENLVDDTLEVFRDPARGQYRDHHTLRRGETIAPVAFPDIELAVSELLP
jgi:Uma2 family endonuclease